jgi:3-dehydroquinate synthase
VVVCADSTVAALYGDQVVASLAAAGLRTHLHTFPSGDASKNLLQLDRIYETLGKHGVGRDGVLLALGGGVTSDLTGFAAGTWMRGIRYVTCPTTLEADVDASVGGKTGINHAGGKNMVGVFHHPQLVAIDPECLKTLPAREMSAGLAESVKHALIRDESFLAWHEEHVAGILAADPHLLSDLIERNLRIKASVVEADEREHGLRAILNFGHTIGHALESWSEYALRHGEAVALGMMAALHLSREAGLDPAIVTRVRAMLAALKLPVATTQPVDIEAVAALTHGDKKAMGGARRWVLLEAIGKPVIRADVADASIHAAIAAVSGSGRQNG